MLSLSSVSGHLKISDQVRSRLKHPLLSVVDKLLDGPLHGGTAVSLFRQALQVLVLGGSEHDDLVPDGWEDHYLNCLDTIQTFQSINESEEAVNLEKQLKSINPWSAEIIIHHLVRMEMIRQEIVKGK